MEPTTRRLPAVVEALVVLVSALIAFALALVCWSDGHVTYALPNGVGHDTLGRPLAGAYVCAVLGVLTLPAGYVATRGRVRWLGVLVLLVPLLALLVAIWATRGPQPVY
ncbi:hypothetical protein [Nocardioides montaniterrae]